MAKNYFYKISIFIVIIFFQSCETDTYTVSEKYMVNCQLHPNQCGPLIIKRESTSDNVVITFSINPDQLLLGLYNSSIDSLSQPSLYKYLKPIRKGFLYIKNKP